MSHIDGEPVELNIGGTDGFDPDLDQIQNWFKGLNEQGYGVLAGNFGLGSSERDQIVVIHQINESIQADDISIEAAEMLGRLVADDQWRPIAEMLLPGVRELLIEYEHWTGRVINEELQEAAPQPGEEIARRGVVEGQGRRAMGDEDRRQGGHGRSTRTSSAAPSAAISRRASSVTTAPSRSPKARPLTVSAPPAATR